MNVSSPDQNTAYIAWKDWTPDMFLVCSSKDAAVYALELARAGITIKEESRVLEIGFGNASFAAWVMARTPHYVGTENNEILVNRARERGIEAHPAALSLDDVAKGRVFDLIAIFDVLEHLELDKAIQLLQSAAAHLAVSGHLIVRVPSGDSPFSGHLMYGDVTHRLNLGRFAFFQLAKIAGLEIASVRGSAYPIQGMGLLAMVRRTAITAMRAIINGLLKITYYANEPVVLAPTLTAVLRRTDTQSI